jgi:hypothetical protein
MDRITKILTKLISLKFSGDVVITFNQGGVRSIKKVKYELI